MGSHMVWAEVRCDAQDGASCSGSGPSGFIHGAVGLKRLVDAACQLGWDTREGKAICPDCVRFATGCVTARELSDARRLGKFEAMTRARPPARGELV